MRSLQIRRGLWALVAFLALELSGCGGGGPTPPPIPSNPTTVPAAKTLPITPIAQETIKWCWAASAQMIFQYYGIPNVNPGEDYQCGLVAVYFGRYYPICNYNCYQCVAGVPTMDQEQLLINGYGGLVNRLGYSSRVLSSVMMFSALPYEQVMTEIVSGRPVLAGISNGHIPYPDFPEHAVVVVGYDTTVSPPGIVVNDPFPYTAAGMPDPYLVAGGLQVRPGQYLIPYVNFVTALTWGNTLYQIE